jgi:hypothetical protein
LISPNNPTYTIIGVWQTNVKAVQIIFNQTDAAFSCNGVYAGMFTSTTSLNAWGCGMGFDYGSLPFNIKTSYISIVRVNKNQTNKVNIYLNGSSQSGSPPSIANLGSGIIGIGSSADGIGYHFNGYISEIIVFNRALSNSDIAGVQNYLSSKYSINLD